MLLQAGLNAKEFLGGFGSTSLFGAAVNKAFGANKGAKNASSNAGNGSFLNENGMDMDELSAQENLNQGDYSTKFVDDEEEYVAVEQVCMCCDVCECALTCVVCFLRCCQQLWYVFSAGHAHWYFHCHISIVFSITQLCATDAHCHQYISHRLYEHVCIISCLLYTHAEP